MGSISDAHVEWAVVGRFKAMLDEPPKTKFNVTQAFALFSTIVLWTKQRAWVPLQSPLGPADQAARAVRGALQEASILDAPWLLSRSVPQSLSINRRRYSSAAADNINVDFVGMSPEHFIKWVRDALAHGDGRTTTPLHKLSTKGDKTLLAGFRIIFPEARGSNRSLRLDLYLDDMKRIGAILAHEFCTRLAADEQYFELDIGTRSIKEAA